MKKLTLTLTFCLPLLLAALPAHGAIVNTFEETSPNSYSGIDGVDMKAFLTTTNGPEFLGAASGNLFAVSNFGCGAGDYSGISAGDIALILRGSCSYAQKGQNAASAGATGFLVYNSLSGLVVAQFAGVAVSIPGMFLSQALGQQLVGELHSGAVAVSFSTQDAQGTPEPASVTMLAGALALAGMASRRFHNRA